MPVIDEDGDLFGVVNAVDALAVVVVLLALAGGVVVLTGGGGAEGGTLTQSVTVRTTGAVPAGVATLEPGPVANEQVAAIERVEQVQAAGNGTNATYELDVQLVIGTAGSGAPTFAGERLYIGRSVTLDLENVTVSGVVTAAREPERVESIPTPTPTPTPTPPPTTAPPTTTATQTPTTVPPTQTTAPTQTTTPEPTTTRVVTLEATVDAAVADTVTEGPVMERDIVAIRDRRVVSETDTATTLRLQVELEVVEEDGIVYFRGVALEPGTRLRLPVGGTTLAGTVTGV